MTPYKKRLPLKGLKANPAIPKQGSQLIDFARGPAEMADALDAGRTPRLGADFTLHVTELSLVIQDAGTRADSYEMTTDFPPMAPMEWAT